MTDLSLAGTWAELVTGLETAGFSVASGIPEAIEPPAVILSTGDPYLEESDTFGPTLIANLELFVLFEITTAETFIAGANRAIQDVLLALDDRWSFKGASAPFRARNVSGLPASRIRISTTITITEGD